jgi:hypothetical protein
MIRWPIASILRPLQHAAGMLAGWLTGRHICFLCHGQLATGTTASASSGFRISKRETPTP